MTKLVVYGAREARGKFFKGQSLLVCSVLGVGLCGCSHVAATRERVKGKLEEHSQALTTAIVDTLELEPMVERSAASELALMLAREDQRVEGLPPAPIAVERLLTDGQSGEAVRARGELEERFAEVRKLLERERRLTRRLVKGGVEYEREVNSRRARWMKLAGSTTFLIGGATALCVFVPAAIPLFGRVLAWVAGKVPALASVLGVVSVRALDAVVRGIERARGSGDEAARKGETVRLGNAPANGEVMVGRGPAETLAFLESALAREMDGDHKRLVRARKAALKI